MNKSSGIKTGLFSLWAFLVAATSIALYNQDKFFAVDIQPIAFLADKSGTVMVRPEGLVRWTEVEEKHGFFDGDRVATARDSKSKVEFGHDRALVMGENTQIQVTRIGQSNRDYSFMIKLLRGTMVAEVGECGGCSPLVVRAGSKSYNVTSGEKVGLFKPVGKKAKTFDPKGPWPAQLRSKNVALVDSDFITPPSPPVAIPPKVVQPKLVPPPAPKVVMSPPPPPPPSLGAKGFELRVLGESRVWSTTRSLAALNNAELDFPVQIPDDVPPESVYVPLIEIAGPGGQGPAQVLSEFKSEGQTISLPIERIRQSAAVGAHGPFTTYTFTLRGGARIQLNDGAGQKTAAPRYAQSFSDKRVAYRLIAYGEVGSGPVTIGFDQLRGIGDNQPFIAPKPTIQIDDAPISLFLEDAEDYGRLLPFVRGAGALGVKPGKSYEKDGVFFVRGQKVIAQLKGRDANPNVGKALLNSLEGDFVFKGSREAFYDARGKSQGDLVGFVGALLEEGKVLYILKRNKLYPVSREFIKNSNEVAQFIDSQAKAIFLEKVEIWGYR